MSFSIITVTLNSNNTLLDTLESVGRQKSAAVQHVIKDGGSTDGTLELVRSFPSQVQMIEQGDIGIYDAMNQGFAAATGDYVGFLNSDDFLSYDTVLQDVEEVFVRSGVDIVYGDIEIINANAKVVRQWRSGYLRDGKLKGKQLPHPAFFVRRKTLQRLGKPFDASYQISADFKQQIQLINEMGTTAAYLSKTLVTMRKGGASSASMSAVLKGWRECIRAHGEVTGEPGVGFVIGKVARKVLQLLPSFLRPSEM